jgi:hypothetical protein
MRCLSVEQGLKNTMLFELRMPLYLCSASEQACIEPGDEMNAWDSELLKRLVMGDETVRHPIRRRRQDGWRLRP